MRDQRRLAGALRRLNADKQRTRPGGAQLRCAEEEDRQVQVVDASSEIGGTVEVPGESISRDLPDRPINRPERL